MSEPSLNSESYRLAHQQGGGSVVKGLLALDVHGIQPAVEAFNARDLADLLSEGRERKAAAEALFVAGSLAELKRIVGLESQRGGGDAAAGGDPLAAAGQAAGQASQLQYDVMSRFRELEGGRAITAMRASVNEMCRQVEMAVRRRSDMRGDARQVEARLRAFTTTFISIADMCASVYNVGFAHLATTPDGRKALKAQEDAFCPALSYPQPVQLHTRQISVVGEDFDSVCMKANQILASLVRHRAQLRVCGGEAAFLVVVPKSRDAALVMQKSGGQVLCRGCGKPEDKHADHGCVFKPLVRRKRGEPARWEPAFGSVPFHSNSHWMDQTWGRALRMRDPPKSSSVKEWATRHVAATEPYNEAAFCNRIKDVVRRICDIRSESRPIETPGSGTIIAFADGVLVCDTVGTAFADGIRVMTHPEANFQLNEKHGRNVSAQVCHDTYLRPDVLNRVLRGTPEGSHGCGTNEELNAVEFACSRCGVRVKARTLAEARDRAPAAYAPDQRPCDGGCAFVPSRAACVHCDVAFDLNEAAAVISDGSSEGCKMLNQGAPHHPYRLKNHGFELLLDAVLDEEGPLRGAMPFLRIMLDQIEDEETGWASMRCGEARELLWLALAQLGRLFMTKIHDPVTKRRTPDTAGAQVYQLIIGKGGTGKTTLVSLLEKIFGEEEHVHTGFVGADEKFAGTPFFVGEGDGNRRLKTGAVVLNECPEFLTTTEYAVTQSMVLEWDQPMCINVKKGEMEKDIKLHGHPVCIGNEFKHFLPSPTNGRCWNNSMGQFRRRVSAMLFDTVTKAADSSLEDRCYQYGGWIATLLYAAFAEAKREVKRHSELYNQHKHEHYKLEAAIARLTGRHLTWGRVISARFSPINWYDHFIWFVHQAEVRRRILLSQGVALDSEEMRRKVPIRVRLAKVYAQGLDAYAPAGRLSIQSGKDEDHDGGGQAAGATTDEADASFCTEFRAWFKDYAVSINNDTYLDNNCSFSADKITNKCVQEFWGVTYNADADRLEGVGFVETGYGAAPEAAADGEAQPERTGPQERAKRDFVDALARITDTNVLADALQPRMSYLRKAIAQTEEDRSEGTQATVAIALETLAAYSPDVRYGVAKALLRAAVSDGRPKHVQGLIKVLADDPVAVSDGEDSEDSEDSDGEDSDGEDSEDSEDSSGDEMELPVGLTTSASASAAALASAAAPASPRGVPMGDLACLGFAAAAPPQRVPDQPPAQPPAKRRKTTRTVIESSSDSSSDSSGSSDSEGEGEA